MRGKWILLAGITILLAISAGAISVYLRSSPHSSTSRAQTAPQTPARAPVSEVSVTGIIQAQRVVNVPAPVDGTVESFRAEVGEDVFEGQLIANIQNAKLASAVEGANLELERIEARVHELEAAIIAARLEASRAEADRSRAKTEFDRLDKIFERQRMLMKEGATPRLVFEKSEREYNSAKEDADTKEKLAQQSEERMDDLNRQLDAAKRALEERQQAAENAKASVAAGEVRAPVDGIVISRRGQPGDEVNRNMQDLFRIAVALSALEVHVQPEPLAVARIKIGQPAFIHVAEAPDVIAGTVREMKEGLVIVDFTSPAPAIHPGMTAQVRIPLN